jgi:uncharacterized membrane protein
MKRAPNPTSGQSPACRRLPLKSNVRPLKKHHGRRTGRMHELTHIITVAALLCSGALFGAALYDSVVLAPNLRSGPAGLEHGRLFMGAATPANLFRVLSPATQLLTLLAVGTNWASPPCRWPLVGALIALVASDIITFKYHYPRNRLLFGAPLSVAPEELAAAARQWASGNLLRVALVLIAWLSTLTSLLRSAA